MVRYIFIFKGFEKKIFYSQTKFTTSKVYVLSKLSMKKLKIVRKIFPATFGHRKATKIPRPNDIYWRQL